MTRTKKPVYFRSAMVDFQERIDNGLNCRGCGSEWIPLPDYPNQRELVHDADCPFHLQRCAEEDITIRFRELTEEIGMTAFDAVEAITNDPDTIWDYISEEFLDYLRG